MAKDFRRKLSVKKFVNRQGEHKYIVVDGNDNPVSGIQGQSKEDAIKIKNYINDYEEYASRYTISQLRSIKPQDSYEEEIIDRAIKLRRR